MAVKGPDATIIIVANKADQPCKVKKTNIKKMVVNEWENDYFECSAKLNNNIKEVFHFILEKYVASNIMDHPSTLSLDIKSKLETLSHQKRKRLKNMSFSTSTERRHRVFSNEEDKEENSLSLFGHQRASSHARASSINRRQSEHISRSNMKEDHHVGHQSRRRSSIATAIRVISKCIPRI